MTKPDAWKSQCKKTLCNCVLFRSWSLWFPFLQLNTRLYRQFTFCCFVPRALVRCRLYQTSFFRRCNCPWKYILLFNRDFAGNPLCFCVVLYLRKIVRNPIIYVSVSLRLSCAHVPMMPQNAEVIYGFFDKVLENNCGKIFPEIWWLSKRWDIAREA